MNYNEFLHTKVEVTPVSGFEVRREWCSERINTMAQFHDAVAV